MVHSPWPITIAIVVQIMTNSYLLLKWHNLLPSQHAMDHRLWTMDYKLPLLPFLQLIIKLLQKVFGKVAQVF